MRIVLIVFIARGIRLQSMIPIGRVRSLRWTPVAQEKDDKKENCEENTPMKYSVQVNASCAQKRRQKISLKNHITSCYYQ